MTPTMEEVAGWLRQAGKVEEIRYLRSGASIKAAREAGETWYDRAAQVEAMGWRPISEAPKNERVLLWAEGWYAPNTGEWAKTGFSPDGYCEWAHQPTHYRPNAQPPVNP